jgi:hypothetical protein
MRPTHEIHQRKLAKRLSPRNQARFQLWCRYYKLSRMGGCTRKTSIDYANRMLATNDSVHQVIKTWHLTGVVINRAAIELGYPINIKPPV